MAEVGKLTVAVEKVVIHDVLKQAIQSIADEHGLTIESINVDWTRTLGGDADIPVNALEGCRRSVCCRKNQPDDG